MNKTNRGTASGRSDTSRLAPLILQLGMGLDVATVEAIALRLARLISRARAAEIAGVSKTTILNAARLWDEEEEDGLRAQHRRGLETFTMGSEMFIRPEALEAWMAKRKGSQ